VTRTGLVLDDRYQLTEPIAAGGVGQVWQAVDLLLNRPVAVKLLRPEYADHPETLERFRAEARHAGSLTHPCIARVYDYGDAGPAAPPYLVMEFVNGPSLADLLVVEPVSPVLALDVVAQVAAGLDAAHRAGLVHRDIKPGNILIGDDGLVKITDFGIAHAAGSAPITGPGLVMGTTQYMAPERISGGQATPASDLYSLGIIFYECLTGLAPYDGGTAEVMAGHLYLPLPPLPACVPPEFDDLVRRLTAKDPAVRMADAAQIAATARRLRDVIAADPGLAGTALAGAGLAGAGTIAAGVSPMFTGAGLTVGAGLAAGPGLAAAGAGLDPSWAAFTGTGPAGVPRQSASYGMTGFHEYPPKPTGPGRPFRPGRRRAAAFAAGATVLAGAGVAWLLAAGTPHDTATADHASLPATATPAAPASSARSTAKPTHPAAPGASSPAGHTTAKPSAKTSPAAARTTPAAGPSTSSGSSPAPASSATSGGATPTPSASTTTPGLPWPFNGLDLSLTL